MIQQYCAIILFVLLSLGACAREKRNIVSQAEQPATAQNSHPRLLLLKGEEKLIHQSIQSDLLLKKVHDQIIEESNKMIPLPTLERIVTGRRLLSVSREAIRRIFFLSYAWRMTHEPKYRQRAEEELLKIASFSDWHPDHFLDVAEMTLGVAIGYDWLFDVISPEKRRFIKNAIIEKGLEPSMTGKSSWTGWLSSAFNWNQVCNAGLTFGALAIYEDYSDSANLIVQRAATTIKKAMETYNPDGAYPEGYSYWDYGTTFNALFLDAYNKFHPSGFDLSFAPGFLKTAAFMLHMIGPSGYSFNYSDAGTSGTIQPGLYWFASQLNDASLLFYEKHYLANNTGTAYKNERLLPAVLCWIKGKTLNSVTTPTATTWHGNGPNPVAMMRSSWTDPNAIYTTLKCGSPAVNHGHMDIGSFVMDADGERWAMDFGMQNYNSLETAGVDLWNMKQNSQRWTVFRYNSLAHNTLSINGQYQQVQGSAPLSSFSSNPGFTNAVTNMSSVYTGQLAKANRGIAMIKNNYVLVRDEIQALSSGTASVRWTMATPATVSILDDSTVSLSKGSKKLLLKFVSNLPFTIKTWPTTGSQPYDAPNPGTTLLGFETLLAPGASSFFNVFLIPERNLGKVNSQVPPLNTWPKD